MSKALRFVESVNDTIAEHVYADERWGSAFVGGVNSAVEAVFDLEQMKAIKHILIKYALPHDEWALKYNLPTNLPLDVIEWLKS